MRLSPLVAVPVVAAAPLVGAAAISFPGVFGGPIVVLVVGYAVPFVAAVVSRAAGGFAAGWWLLAFAALVPPMLPVVVIPGVGTFRVPAFTGTVAWWVGAGLSVAWWVVLLHRPVVDAFRTGSEDEVDDCDPVPDPVRHVRDLTRTEVPVAGVPLRADGVREVPLARDRYADVVIGDPNKDNEDELSLLDQVADLFPDRRRSETGKVSVRDVADRLDMTVPEVAGRLAQDGVPVARLNGVTPLAGGGSASAMNAVRWVDISRAAEERGR